MNDLARQLRDEAERDRPSFDAARHERLMRAIHRDVAAESSSLRIGPPRHAWRAKLAIAATLGVGIVVAAVAWNAHRNAQRDRAERELIAQQLGELHRLIDFRPLPSVSDVEPISVDTRGIESLARFVVQRVEVAGSLAVPVPGDDRPMPDDVTAPPS